MEIFKVPTNLYTYSLFFKRFHTLVEHLNEPVQESGPAALSGTDIDKSVVVIAQVHIVEVFKMRGHFLDVHGTAVDRFTGM